MHKSRTVFLVNDKVRGILATYEADTPNTKAPATFFKTFDTTIQTGDFVVVPTNTRHNMTVCKVVAIDVEVEIDSEVECHWIIGRIDAAAYEKTLSQEGEMLNVIRSAEKTKKRNELREAVLADAGEKVKTLAIANLSDPAKLAAK